MKNAIILHGLPDKKEYYDPKVPSASNHHWIPWLQKELLSNEIAAQTPEVPHAFEAHYESWKKEFERFEITPETILVGHSCGGGFIVRWLSEHKNVKVGNVILVAPWIDPTKELGDNDFFDFKVDPNVTSRTKKFVIFNSDNDSEAVHKSIQIIKDTVKGTKFVEFHNYGHFCLEDMKTTKFPELLAECLK
ncbi:MAG: alpha/beta fold hydrolase [Patescibacteria group bacterium]